MSDTSKKHVSAYPGAVYEITDRRTWNQMEITVRVIETSRHKLLNRVGLWIAKVGLIIAGVGNVIIDD